MAHAFVRCPLCGMLRRAQALNMADQHRLEQGRFHGLGRARGFRFERWALSNEVMLALVLACATALKRLVLLLQPVSRPELRQLWSKAASLCLTALQALTGRRWQAAEVRVSMPLFQRQEVALSTGVSQDDGRREVCEMFERVETRVR